jgi:hypothetical protein
MKKILVILTVIFAATVVTSCVKPFEPTISLSISNRALALKAAPDAHPDGIPGNFQYIQICSTGTWEATIETEDGTAWCWLNDHYLTARKGADGKVLVDEMGMVITDKTYIVEGIEKFKGTDKFCKVRGTGMVYLPMQFTSNPPVVRYATFYVRRVDTGEVCEMKIKQNK